jgi:hypothetical protein
MTPPTLSELVAEYDRALAFTAALTDRLDDDEVGWRPHAEFSPIGWHLAHQAAVAHYMVRNLTAAAPRLDPELEALADSATPEAERSPLPPRERITQLRAAVAAAVRAGIGRIHAGDVGAPAQLRVVATTLITALVNHEYQHSTWIAEVRTQHLGLDPLPLPTAPLLTVIEGYPVLVPSD